ncbi:TlpA family protein disulfide reductase [Lapillicoccus sp.]|uniref:TlpA family protein disulfide reductase n=1 Tax=Lapillicoccus sp. TaxID=1909287 RepID=UPI003983D45C
MTVQWRACRGRRGAALAVALLGVSLFAGCGTPNLAEQAAAADAAASAAPGLGNGPPDEGPAQPVVKVPLEPCPASVPASGGDRLPQLQLTCLGAGPAVDMAAGHGRPTVVNVWASWCAPCRTEMPRLRASAARLAPATGFLGVDVKDDPGAAWAFLAQMQVHYPNVSDPSAALLAGLHVPGVPITFVLDSTGAIVFRHLGELHESDIAEMETAARSAR